MKKLSTVTAVLVLVMLLSCCWRAIQGANRRGLMRLELGMTMSHVLRVMGTPDLKEAYRLEKGEALEVLFYYTNRKWGNGNITKDECTPIVFEAGKLIGWGDLIYQAKVRVAVEIIRR